MPCVPVVATERSAAGRDLAMGGAIVLALLLGALGVSSHDAARQGEVVRLVRVKPTDAEIRRLVIDGHQRSGTFRALMDELHQSNMIVTIQFGPCGNGRIRSCVSDVQTDGRQRFVRVKVDTRTTDDRLIATIAHELQHAVEIGRDPEVTTSDQALALYRKIALGSCGQGMSEKCETQAALDVEARVNDELARTPRIVAAIAEGRDEQRP